MPKRLDLSPLLPSLLLEQDGVLTVAQARALGFTRDSIQHRLSTRQWQWILPRVLLTHSQPPTRRQLLYAARAWAGPGAAIDACCALAWYRVPVVGFDPTVVHIVVPYASPARSQSFVRVRRSDRIVVGDRTARLAYVDAATAAIVAARSLRTERQVAALLSLPLQSGAATVDDLVAAHLVGPPKGAALTDQVLDDLAAGVRSASELDVRRMVGRSRMLPEPLWNCWLRLPDGGPLVSPDALWPFAALIHESNGRRFHALLMLFEDMQARHDRLTAAGLTVLHNSPRRIRAESANVLRELERCHTMYDGRGLPPGVEIVRVQRDSGLIVAGTAA